MSFKRVSTAGLDKVVIAVNIPGISKNALWFSYYIVVSII
jgi:hypothetical protein